MFPFHGHPVHEFFDFRLEERNRKYKMNLHTDEPTMSDWNIAAANSDRIDEMRAKASLDYGIKQEQSSPYAPDYDPKIDYCRTQIQMLQFLRFFFCFFQRYTL